MSIARFALDEGAIAQFEPTVTRDKTPPKRRTVALADAAAVPEPR